MSTTTQVCVASFPGFMCSFSVIEYHNDSIFAIEAGKKISDPQSQWQILTHYYVGNWNFCG